MTVVRKILFLVNPISGVGKKKVIPALIDKHFSSDEFQVDVIQTEYRNHGYEIALEQNSNYDCIVAVGGDGSVNEVGSALVDTNCALGIIPSGSGNGLARHLGIPLKIEEAILRIKAFNQMTMDVGKVNDKVFLGTCGFGFDAHIAKKFDDFHKRGFISYIRLVIKEYGSYKPPVFQFTSGDQQWEKELVMCSVANSSQFGNGFFISPNSNVSDGKFELVQIKRFAMLIAPFVVRRFFTKSINRSGYFSQNNLEQDFQIKIPSEEEVYYHVDGEPYCCKSTFNIQLLKQSLKIIC
ncbi:MAG: YegS/Rv2252/BmrU family lipid kinase [Flavobacteriales bacterium]|nr:YegS/Rv2252/BmrU family lipid kinase [Flavobacteriales bacterium]